MLGLTIMSVIENENPFLFFPLQQYCLDMYLDEMFINAM